MWSMWSTHSGYRLFLQHKVSHKAAIYHIILGSKDFAEHLTNVNNSCTEKDHEFMHIKNTPDFDPKHVRNRIIVA